MLRRGAVVAFLVTACAASRPPVRDLVKRDVLAAFQGRKDLAVDVTCAPGQPRCVVLFTGPADTLIAVFDEIQTLATLKPHVAEMYFFGMLHRPDDTFEQRIELELKKP